ncbi:MAG: InlB B-repeat-containing protein [Clostridiales bacterium]|nr:InlB B-repeat-containing protein [Clostridiales bacterium]
MKKLLSVLSAIIALLSIGLISCSGAGDTTDNGDGGSMAQYCIVTFDSQGGSDVENQSVIKGNPVKRPDAPSRADYVFTGWFTEANVEWRFDTDRVSADITLYAGWDEEITEMYITINGNKLTVKLEHNSAVVALVELLKKGDIVYTANDYGGFEKVGSLGYGITTSNDKQITTQPGDVILYSGNQIVLFYGSNSWSYTRLGKIDYSTIEQLRTALNAGNGATQVTLSLH